MMYQYCKPKSEGTIFSKRSKPQGTDRAPHDAAAIVPWQLNQSYEGTDDVTVTLAVTDTGAAIDKKDMQALNECQPLPYDAGRAWALSLVQAIARTCACCMIVNENGSTGSTITLAIPSSEEC